MAVLTTLGALAWSQTPPKWQAVARVRLADALGADQQRTVPASLPATPKAAALIQAARAQIGVTTGYDGSYVALDYPMGDLPRRTGVCTDVVIRALRDARGLDLQAEVHRDMSRAFAAYPQNWGLTRSDRIIDHRRVPNLRAYFKRIGAERPGAPDVTTMLPGDIGPWAPACRISALSRTD